MIYRDTYAAKFVKNIKKEKYKARIICYAKNYFKSILDFASASTAIIVLSAYITGCKNSEVANVEETDMNNNLLPVSDIARKALNKIKNNNIVFAHHSVGENLLDGIKSIANDAEIDFEVTKPSNINASGKNSIIEFSPGKNQQPLSKIDGFVSQMDILKEKLTPDVAFMKFCFIDFYPETDVNEVFNYYKAGIEKIKKNNPDTLIVHFTVPLMASPVDIKNKFKRFIGKDVWVDASNVTRSRFNNLLLQAFPDDPVFDIAKIESTRVDGSRQTFSYNNETYYSLVPEYTDDGSHLNGLGKRFVALAFLKFIAETNKI